MDKDQELRLECLRLSVMQGGSAFSVKYANQYFEFVRNGKVPTSENKEVK